MPSSAYCDFGYRKFGDNRKYPRMYREWLQNQIDERPRGTKARLAEHLGLDADKVSKILSGVREISAEELRLASEYFHTPPPGFSQSPLKLEIVGRVGASTDGEILQASDHGPFGEIEAPIGARGSEAVVEVMGHSMGLYAPDGSLILYDPPHRPASDLLGEICVVGLPDDRVLVKKITRGSEPGLFDLESIVGDTIHDQKVLWASVVLIVIHPQHARRLRLENPL